MREGPLPGRPPRGIRPELVVDRARRLVGEEWRQRVDEIEPARSGSTERVLDIGQLGLEDQAQTRHEVVGLTELRDSLAAPGVPRRLRRAGHQIGVALDDDHVVTVTREEQRSAESADSSPDDENVRHASRARPASRWSQSADDPPPGQWEGAGSNGRYRS